MSGHRFAVSEYDCLLLYIIIAAVGCQMFRTSSTYEWCSTGVTKSHEICEQTQWISFNASMLHTDWLACHKVHISV